MVTFLMAIKRVFPWARNRENVSSDDAVGHRASSTINLLCNKSAVVKIRALATSLMTDEVSLSSGNGSVIAKIFVSNNGGVNGEAITATGGVTRAVEVYSELGRNSNGNIPTGRFSSQGVLIVDIQ